MKVIFKQHFTMGWNLLWTGILVSMHKDFLNYLLNFSQCHTFISLINGMPAYSFHLTHWFSCTYLIRLNWLKKNSILPLIRVIRNRLYFPKNLMKVLLQIGFWDTWIVLADEQATAVRSIQNSTPQNSCQDLWVSHILGKYLGRKFFRVDKVVTKVFM